MSDVTDLPHEAPSHAGTASLPDSATAVASPRGHDFPGSDDEDAPFEIAGGKEPIPPDWNLGANGGTMAVPTINVAEAFRRHPAGYKMWDIAPFRGKVIALRQAAIVRIINLDKPTFLHFVERRLIRRHSASIPGKAEYFRFDPAWSLKDLYENYVAKILEKPQNHRDFFAHKRIQLACRMGADHPVPAVVREAAIEKLSELGSTAMSEINAFIPMGDTVHQQAQDMRRSLNQYWRLREGGSPPKLDNLFIKSQYPAFTHVPGTALDGSKVRRADWPSPRPEWLGRAWRLGPARDAAVLLLYVEAAKSPRTDDLVDLLLAFEALDRALRQAAPGRDYRDPEALTAALGMLAFGSPDVPVSPYQRDRWTRLLLVAMRQLDRWIRHSGGTGFAGFAPAVPSSDEGLEFRTQLNEVYGHLTREAAAERARTAGEAADRLVLLQEVAYLRKEAVADTGAIARRAIAGMGDAPCVKFSVFDRVLSFDGVLLPGAQRNDWVVWRKGALAGGYLPELPDNPPAYLPPEADVINMEDGASVLDEPRINLDGYYFEYLGCEPVVGEDAFDPFFVTILECGAPMAPAALEPEVQEHRHRLIIEAALPTYPSTPAGLLRFGKTDAALFRRMMARRRTVIPLFQMEMAMRFAHLGLRAIVESFCRSGEFRQMQHSRSQWPKGNKSGRTVVDFKAFGKTAKGEGKPTEPDRYPVSVQTHDEAFDLAELVILFCHDAEGELPDIAPPSSLAWKCKPGPYIFSWNGKPLGLQHLLAFLR